MTRIEKIRAALRALAPLELRVDDVSHEHAGHAGAATGRGHFNVEMVSAEFAGLSAVARHRRVYAALGALMDTDIHAVSLRLRAPGE